MNLKSDFFKGVTASLPIILGYLPVAFAFGVLAANNGLPAFITIGMSVFTYAGSAQFLALGLIAQGASIPSLAFAIFIINARYLLMSTAILKDLKAWPTLERVLFSFEMTDETFILHTSRLAQKFVDSKAQIFATNISAHLAWVTGTTIGYFANSFLPDPSKIGLNFALCAMFIALLAPQLRDKAKVCAALLSIGAYILLQLTPLRAWGILIAPTLGAVFMGTEESWQAKISS